MAMLVAVVLVVLVVWRRLRLVVVVERLQLEKWPSIERNAVGMQRRIKARTRATEHNEGKFHFRSRTSINGCGLFVVPASKREKPQTR